MYDIAVYLPGGAVSLLGIQLVAERLNFIGSDLLKGLSEGSAIEQVILGIVWLSASYLLGHVAAFISSYLIEKFVHYSLGYPSDIWLKSEQTLSSGHPRKAIFRKIFQRNLDSYPKYWVPRLIKLAQLPAVAPLLALKFAHPFGFYNHKLPYGILRDLTKRFGELGLNVPVEEGSRWEKIVEHYIANNCPPAYSRMYNYLVIYGVLRMSAFIILAYLWFWIAKDVYLKVCSSDILGSISLEATLVYIATSCLYVLSVMAFAKFNRRYFEETVLAFLLATDEALAKRAPSNPRIIV